MQKQGTCLAMTVTPPPATASAEGAQLNGRPSRRERELTSALCVAKGMVPLLYV